MTAPKEAGQWILLSRWVTNKTKRKLYKKASNEPSRQLKKAVSDLMKDLAADRCRYRYFNTGDNFIAADPPPEPMEAVTFEEAVRLVRKPAPPPPAPTPSQRPSI